MDVDDDEDLVPEILKRHFEEAMKFARRCVVSVYLFILAYFMIGPCLTMTSRNMRCSARLCSSREDLAPTSGSLMGPVGEVPLQEDLARATSTRMMMTTSTVRRVATTLCDRLLCANYLKYLQL